MSELQKDEEPATLVRLRKREKVPKLKSAHSTKVKIDGNTYEIGMTMPSDPSNPSSPDQSAKSGHEYYRSTYP